MQFEIRVVIVFLISLIGGTENAEWNYRDEKTWPGECRLGHQQSPINIIRADAVPDPHGVHIRGQLVMRGYDNIKVAASNNGHSLVWSLDKEWVAPVISGGPLRGNYSLVQFHLHWLSEHAIDGKKYPLEIHMVHVRYGLTIEEALKRSDGLAVVGIIAEVRISEDCSHALQELMPVVPDLIHRTEEPTEKKMIDATRFFSSNMQAYYTYHGSLTTPHCEEVVTWIVMDNPISICDSQYKTFSTVDVGGISNFRSLQPVNRVVYRSSATKLCPGIIGILALFNCLSHGLSDVIKKGICTGLNIKKWFLGNILNLNECAKLID